MKVYMHSCVLQDESALNQTECIASVMHKPPDFKSNVRVCLPRTLKRQHTLLTCTCCVHLASPVFDRKARNIMKVCLEQEEDWTDSWYLSPCAWNPKFFELDPSVHWLDCTILGVGGQGQVT